MHEISEILAFTSLAIAISLSPGPGAIQAIYTGSNYGFARGQLAILGMQFGYLSHMLIVAFGYVTVIAKNDWILTTVRWLGGFYLLYLGLSMAIGSRNIVASESGKKKPNQSLWHTFISSVLINLLNPKSLVFMLAVLPQFIDYSSDLVSQVLIIGLIMVIVDWVVMNAYVAIGKSSQFFQQHPKILLWQNIVLGTIVSCLAVLLMFKD